MTARTARCSFCGRALTFEQFHTGFNNTGYAYCDRDGALAVWETFDPAYRALVGDQHPWTLTAEDRKRVDQALRPCSCGGRFSMDNPPRCPHCSAGLPDLLPGKIYFADFGNSLPPPVWVTTPV